MEAGSYGGPARASAERGLTVELGEFYHCDNIGSLFDV